MTEGFGQEGHRLSVRALPVVILTAAGVVPIRLKGSVSEAVTKADAYMETMICPFVRNVFDVALKGRYAFLDGMVLSHQSRQHR